MAGQHGQDYWPTPAESKVEFPRNRPAQHPKIAQGQRPSQPFPGQHPSSTSQSSTIQHRFADSSQSSKSPEFGLERLFGFTVTRQSYHDHTFAPKSSSSPESTHPKSNHFRPESRPIMTKAHLFESAPHTARNLTSYTKCVESRCMYGFPSLRGLINHGKLNPSKYGSIREKDLGLCYETFFTMKACKHGSQCRWRHHVLTQEECEWVLALGAKCLDRMVCCWSAGGLPESTPFFPACMYDT